MRYCPQPGRWSDPVNERGTTPVVFAETELEPT
jgi:hypothetical protein